VKSLAVRLKRGGLESLIGNNGYRKFLDVNGEWGIDEDAGKAEARYDGKYVPLTNTELPTAEAALAYKELWQVEAAFRELKSQLEIAPVYHWTEPRVRAHVAICFLSFVLEVELRKRLKQLGVKAVHVRIKGRDWRVRTELEGQAFKAAGVPPPPRVIQGA